MCNECHQSPCDTRCPNAPEPPIIHTCDECHEPVRAGDIYFEERGGEILCQTCVENMDTYELLIHFGCTSKTAEEAA